MSDLLTDGLMEQLEDSKGILEVLTESIFVELKGAATEAHATERQRRLAQQQKRHEAKQPPVPSRQRASDEFETRSDNHRFWATPETGQPGSGTPRSSPLRLRGNQPSPSHNPPKTNTHQPGAEKNHPDHSLGARALPSSADVLGQIKPLVTAVRVALSRGPAYDPDGAHDTAAAPFAPSKAARRARRASHPRAEQQEDPPKVRRKGSRRFFFFF